MSTPETAAALKKIFEGIKLSSLFSANSKVVEVSTDDHVDAAFSKVVAGGVLSAPVYNPTEKKYIGFLDMRDLISVIVEVSKSGEVPKNIEDFLVMARKSFAQETNFITVSYLARRNPFHPVDSNATLLDVLKELSVKRAVRVRRVPVMDSKTGKVVGIISQSSLIKVLNDHIDMLPQLHLDTMDSCHIGSSHLISVDEMEPTVNVYTLLDAKALSGCAILDSQGKLVGNVSGKDLKLFLGQNPDFNLLNVPIGEYIKKVRQESLDIRSPTMCCFKHTTIAQVVGKLCATNVHRLFCVDSETSFRPIGVVSLTDILRHYGATA